MSDECLLLLREVDKDMKGPGGSVPVLRQVSLTVGAGERLAILGPSGSGKSTLLNLLGLLDRPSRGAHWFAGHAVEAMEGRARTRLRGQNIGFVFQQFHLLPHLSAGANVALPLRYAMWRGADIERRVQEAMQSVGMAHRLGRLPSQLSGGERQRVAVARALAVRPALLLADEPTAALDSENGRQVLALMLAAQRQHGMTLVVVTHDAAIAARFPRRVHMRDGCLEREERDAQA